MINSDFGKENFAEYQFINRNGRPIQLGGSIAFIQEGKKYQNRTLRVESLSGRDRLLGRDNKLNIQYPPSMTAEDGRPEPSAPPLSPDQYLTPNQLPYVIGQKVNPDIWFGYQGSLKDQEQQDLVDYLKNEISYLKYVTFLAPSNCHESVQAALTLKNRQKELDGLYNNVWTSDIAVLKNVESRVINAKLYVSQLSDLCPFIKGNKSVTELKIDLLDYQESNRPEVEKQIKELIYSLPSISEVMIEGSRISVINTVEMVKPMKKMTPVGISLHNIDKKLLHLKQKYISTFINVIEQQISSDVISTKVEYVKEMAGKFLHQDVALVEKEPELYKELFNQLSSLQHEIGEETSANKIQLHMVLMNQCATELLEHGNIEMLFLPQTLDKQNLLNNVEKISDNINVIKKAGYLSALIQFPTFKEYCLGIIKIIPGADKLIEQLDSPTLTGMLEGDAIVRYNGIIEQFVKEQSKEGNQTEEFKAFNAMYKYMNEDCKQQNKSLPHTRGFFDPEMPITAVEKK